MSRYVIKFSKQGNIKYISHLDMLRLFKRSFKLVGIRLQYSQGFNPHPKMSFAQPLSLGYESIGEYLEFDTINPCVEVEIIKKLNSVMPDGVEIMSCKELSKEDKTLAALTYSAEYDITIPMKPTAAQDISQISKKFFSQDQISVMKHQRKSGKDIQIDIKPMITEINCVVSNNNLIIACKIDAGSAANLSPEMVLTSFCEFAGIQFDRAEVAIKRREIYFSH